MPTTVNRALAVALSAAVLALPSVALAQDHSEAGNLSGSGVHVDPAASALPNAPVASFLVADLDTGEILAAQNAHLQRPPASTLKMLTALTVLPRVNLDTIYTAAYDDVAVEGSRVGIVEDSTYTARQLFEGMLLVSGNDAAHAVAGLNGGIDTTVEQMQAEADRLQADDTVVRNPSGLDAPGQLSTAYDLALIARAGMGNHLFAEFVGTSHSVFPVEGTTDPTERNTFEIWNQNTLVTGDYDGGIGVKSGYTTQAGRTLAAAAERDGHRYLVTLMGIAGNTYDTGEMYLDWAFKNSGIRPVGQLVEPTGYARVSDAAVVVPAKQAAAPAEAPIATGNEQATEPATVDASPALLGQLRLGAALISLACCLLLWWRLRAQHRRALKRRSPAPIDLRDGRDVRAPQDVRV